MSGIEDKIRESVPLAPLTTLQIGGPARWLVEAESEEEMRAALAWAAMRGVEAIVLGGGSNVVIADEGFDGLVVLNRIRGVTFSEDGLVRSGAGEEWDGLVASAVDRDLAGIEALSGIPGLVGATPIQNVGAYGQEVAETIAGVEAIESRTGKPRTFTNAECGFAYRNSIFKSDARGEFVITSVTFRLSPGGAPALRYPELQREVEARFGAHPTLAQVREAVIAIRKKKGMVLDPADPDTRSDGSFFTNPIVGEEDYREVARRALALDAGLTEDRIPAFPAGEGLVKLSAAWLIERAGFTKGYGDGRVGLSTKHTLAIVNRGGGTAAEVLALMGTIQRTVAQRFGVLVTPEPNFVGFEAPR
ncbi:MAG: UDP-N-acetylmuramate dehydrogenase [Thermoanaerobaculia bacterium]